MNRAAFILLLLCLPVCALAGPYAPAAGVAGTTAIHKDDSSFQIWASRVTQYAVGAECLPQWQDTSKVLGKAAGDPLHVTCLGNGGSITLAFDGYIRNGAGADFAIFENSVNNTFLELAYVEVSADGVSFVRFPNNSLTPAPVTSFGGIDPTNIKGLGSKYRVGYGEPYDLADVGLDYVSHVRLVDVVGDGSARDSANRIIYDPYPNAQTAGFDLEAIGVMHFSAWRSMQLATFGLGANATALAHLPDGRFVFGAEGALHVQNQWALSTKTTVPSGGVIFDPSCLAVRNATSAILGRGGNFDEPTGIHRFDPSSPVTPIISPALSTLKNFTAAYWKSPVTSREGWLIAGDNGPNENHAVSFVSVDGAVSGFITEELCTYSAGIAVDAAGNLFTALYELSYFPNAADAEKVLKFSAANVEAAIAALYPPINNPAPMPRSAGAFVYKFDSAGSIAVDSMGRLWASGFKVNHLQVYDPLTGAMRRIVPDHPVLPPMSDAIYQPRAFTRAGEGFIGFLVQDEGGAFGSPIIYGYAPVSTLQVPNSLTNWQRFRFGDAVENPSLESTIWGVSADPDHDGAANLLEYANGTLPFAADVSSMSGSVQGSALAFSFLRDPLNQDLIYAVEVSSTLAPNDWQEIARSTGGAATVSSGSVSEASEGARVRVTVVDSFTGGLRRFARLRILLQGS